MRWSKRLAKWDEWEAEVRQSSESEQGEKEEDSAWRLSRQAAVVVEAQAEEREREREQRQEEEEEARSDEKRFQRRKRELWEVSFSE